MQLTELSQTPSWWGEGWLPPTQELHPASALGASDCGPAGLANPFSIIPHFQIPSDVTGAFK